MLFSEIALPEPEVRAMSPRVLAHLGDAVFHLYEREREVASASSASQMHHKVIKRASAEGQAELLDLLTDKLTEIEADIVRRGRNMKPQRQRRSDQSTYRKATSFEALLGYLYLTDRERLKAVLDFTLTDSSPMP